MIGFQDIEEAAERLRGVAHRTPVLTSRRLDNALGAHAFLKAENLQRGGAFKIRGAFNRMARLSSGELAAGVASFSSGNHAQAVSIAAGILKTRVVILMPADTPAAKLDATRSYGAEVVTYDRYSEDRTALGTRLARDRGLTLVRPYDDPLVMAGQGTAALELLADVGRLDVLVVPVGGGGLISGCATAAKSLAPGMAVVGVEPETGDDTKRSLDRGERVAIPVPRTIADGQQADTPGELTFEVMRERVDDIVLVSDAEIVGAMAFLFETMKIVVEPSGATGLAALLAGRVDVSGRRFGVILSGGNVGAERFCSLLASGPSPRRPDGRG